MATLDVYLFGGFDLQSDGEPLPAIPTLKGRSLFAYLITHRDQPHTRDLLAGLFWPDMPDARARRRLSQALWQIRRSLDVLAGADLYLIADSETVQFDAQAPYWLDIEAFQAACGGLHAHRQRLAPPTPRQPRDIGANKEIEALRKAVGLYSGAFMAGFYDDWVIVERERLRDMYLTALDRLVELCKAHGAYEEALTYARRLTVHDPLREKAHREVIACATSWAGSTKLSNSTRPAAPPWLKN